MCSLLLITVLMKGLCSLYGAEADQAPLSRQVALLLLLKTHAVKVPE